jgi:hypothetical protein
MPREVQQIREQRRPDVHAQHNQLVRPRRAMSNEPTRVIRAKAEVTIVDRDHVVVTLTRHGIGDVNAASGSRLSSRRDR